VPSDTKPSYLQVHSALEEILGDDLHAKRVTSLAHATLGVIQAGSLAVCMIGHGLAAARDGSSKHATKQVDRLLSNSGIDVDAILARWIPFVLGERRDISVAMDWTDFDADKQATIMLSLITDHGRATPLMWLTVDKATLKTRRSSYEHQVLVRLAEILPADVRVRIVADRGFGDQKLYRMLNEELNFDYVIRFRGDILVTDRNGLSKRAKAWVGAKGRAKLLPDAQVTADQYPVGAVVCVQDPEMKDPWCLATNLTGQPARSLIALYGRRWGIETSFRDTKDLRFGMGMSSARVSTTARRDRLWLINAFAVTFLTVLGQASEALGYDRQLKTNTSKTRSHSLLRQGMLLYQMIPNMGDARLQPLIEKFAELLKAIPLFQGVFGTV
jgi:hypothetical protein